MPSVVRVPEIAQTARRHGGASAMAVVIVAESLFGNTRMVARAVASGLAGPLGEGAVYVVRPDGAPDELPAELGLLLVGAPTHEFSMPKEQSRRQAVQKGAPGEAQDNLGVREWIGRVTPRADLRVVTFDTSLRTRFSPGFASKSAFKALRKRGFSLAERGPSFWVTGTAGPLVDGEEARAEAWGAELGASLRP